MSSPESDWIKGRERAIGPRGWMSFKARADFSSVFSCGDTWLSSRPSSSARMPCGGSRKCSRANLSLARAYPGIVSAVVALVSVMFVLHGVLAMRKFPANFNEYRSFIGHRKMLRHEDTTLWWVQACDRFCALLFGFRSSLPNAHAPRRYRPLRISGSRLERPLVATVSGACCLLSSCTAASVFTGWRSSGDGSKAKIPKRTRTLLKRLKWGITVFFLTLGPAHLGGLHEDRLRAPGPRRRALRSVAPAAP